MLQAVFGALIYSILGLSTSIYVGKITDYVLVDKNINLLNLMGVIMLVILLLRTFIGAMKSILALKTGQRIDAALILGYYKHLLTLPQQFFDTMRVGEIISRVNDAVKIRNFINNVSLDLVVNIMILVFSVCLMFVYSWELALITLVSAPLFLLIFWGFNKLNRKYQRGIMESSADLEAQLVESLNSISTIKRFGIEEYANLKTETRFVHLLKNTYRSIYIHYGARRYSVCIYRHYDCRSLVRKYFSGRSGVDTRRSDGVLFLGWLCNFSYRLADFFQSDYSGCTDCRRPLIPDYGLGTRTG